MGVLMPKPKEFVFVLMPFDNEFNDIYQLGIKAACESAGVYCERVDEQIFEERILDRIYNQVAKADFLIADMSHRNPNVFYEVGYAHALGKNVILLTNYAEDIPFDLKHFPHIVYGKEITKLKDELERKLNWFVENPSEKNKQLSFDLELYIGKTKLIENEKVIIDELSNTDILMVHNPTSKIFTSGEIKFGLIMDRSLSHRIIRTFLTTDNELILPENKVLRYIPFEKSIFPDGWESILEQSQFVTDFTIRVYTESGTHDFNVEFEDVL